MPLIDLSSCNVTYSDVKSTLESAGFKVTTSDGSQPSDDDIVTSMNPAGGTQVDKGSTITLTVQKAPSNGNGNGNGDTDTGDDTNTNTNGSGDGSGEYWQRPAITSTDLVQHLRSKDSVEQVNRATDRKNSSDAQVGHNHPMQICL